MDLYQQPDIRSKAIAQQRDNEVEQYNEQIELVRQQIVSQSQQKKLRASTEAQRDEAEKSGLGAFTLKGSVKDIKDFAKEGKTDSVAKQIKSNFKDIKEGKIPAVDLEQEGSKIGTLLEKGGLKGEAEKLLEKKGLKYAAEVGSKAATHFGPLMNIGMGIYDGVDALEGDNWEKMNSDEKLETGLQVGAGVADALGIVFPPLFVVGAALSAASSIAGVLGEEDKEEEEVKKGGTIDQETKGELEPLKDVETPDYKAVEVTSRGMG